ncbi:MAG TPA: hypothetical protein VGH96_16790 [Streptosporangiaceae bacterium]
MLGDGDGDGDDCTSAPSVGSGSAAGAAWPCGDTVSVTNDMSVNTIALETSTTSGGMNNIGCPRAAAAPMRVVVRTRSAAMAIAIARTGNLGPWPMRALLRTRMSAARRCTGVSPGSR